MKYIINIIFGGRGTPSLPVISKTIEPFSKIQAPLDSTVSKIPEYGKPAFGIIGDVTGHFKVNMFNFDEINEQKSNINPRANKASELVWLVSLAI